MKLQLQRVVPHATERFHDALDELENEVRLAQTVLRRDMALLKNDRKKKEAAAKQHEVEKARLAAEARNVPAATEDTAHVKEEKAVTPTLPEAPAAQDAPEAATTTEPETDASKKESGNNSNDDSNAKAPSPAKPSTETNTEPPKDPLFDGTPTATNAQESDFDFDAMFGDVMDTSDNHNPDHDMMDTSNDMDFNLDDGNDSSALLRGLEDFAKNGENDNANQSSNMDMDFTMPDLPGLDSNANGNSNTNANADSNANAAAKPTPAPAPEPAPKAEEPKPAAQPPPPEEKKNEPETTNNDDMMGTMAADDLEDLFNMDEYENPEQSSFDDAFFNFE